MSLLAVTAYKILIPILLILCGVYIAVAILLNYLRRWKSRDGNQSGL